MKFNNRNVFISPKAIIGNNVKIGDNSTIYDYVVIGDNTIISNDCVIGEPSADYYSNDNYVNPETYIGENSLIRSHAIIYAGCKIGNYFSTGHRVSIRENTTVGNHCSFGTLADIQGFSVFGDYCKLHSNVHIAQKSTIGNFVFIFPFVVLTNDPQPPSNSYKGATIGDFTVIAVHSIILPEVTIGKNCLIGANTVVNRNFEDECVIIGSPGKKICSIRIIRSREKPGKMHYPWVYNFEHGMPWEGIGFDAWENDNNAT